MSEDSYAVCPQCGEPLTDHTWFGRVLDDPKVWHQHSATERPSDN